MSKVKKYIDEILDARKASYVDNLTVNEALKILNIVDIDYYGALLLSLPLVYKIHLRRSPNSCFSNKYNPFTLKQGGPIWMYNQLLITAGLVYTCLIISQNQNRKRHSLY